MMAGCDTCGSHDSLIVAPLDAQPGAAWISMCGWCAGKIVRWREAELLEARAHNEALTREIARLQVKVDKIARLVAA